MSATVAVTVHEINGSVRLQHDFAETDLVLAVVNAVGERWRVDLVTAEGEILKDYQVLSALAEDGCLDLIVCDIAATPDATVPESPDSMRFARRPDPDADNANWYPAPALSDQANNAGWGQLQVPRTWNGVPPPLPGYA